jgi:hypothetical protein
MSEKVSHALITATAMTAAISTPPFSASAIAWPKLATTAIFGTEPTAAPAMKRQKFA